MKKGFIFIFLIIVGFIFIPNGVLAATLDKSSIEEQFKTIKEKDEDFSYEVNDDNFVITVDGTTYTVNYVINDSTATTDSNTSVFTITSKIDNTTTYEKFEDMMDTNGIFYGFFVDAMNQGQTYEDSSSYLVSKYLEKISGTSGTINLSSGYAIVSDDVTCEDTTKCIKESEFSSRAVEYADYYLKDNTVTDDLFSVIYKKELNSTKDTLTYTVQLKVKDDGDFTVIKGSYDSLSKTFDDLTKALSSTTNPVPATEVTTTSQQVEVPDTAAHVSRYIKLLGVFGLLMGLISIVVGVFYNRKQNQV